MRHFETKTTYNKQTTLITFVTILRANLFVIQYTISLHMLFYIAITILNLITFNSISAD